MSVVMAASRRVQLTTLPCDVPLPPDTPKPPAGVPPPAVPPSGVPQGEEPRPDRPADTDTVRLVLTLFKPDERSFPEFSYSQLVENKINHTEVKVPLSRFEEEEKRANNEAEAMALKLEEKYGGKHEKKDRIQDLIDIGYGYDDEDSFIDNSEAYDEFVPASLTTKLGGFYVNSGVLQFRQASEDTEDLTTEDQAQEASKKRKLNGGQDKPRKKSCREDGGMKINVDLKSSASSEIGPEDGIKKKKKKKKKKKFGTLSVTSMLKKFQREKEKERQKTDQSNRKAAAVMGGAPTIPLCPADAAGGGGSGFTDPLLSLIGSTNDHALIQAANTVDFEIDLDSLLDVSEETSAPKLLPLPATETLLFQPKPDDQNQPDTTNAQAQPPYTKTNLQLKPYSDQVEFQSQSSSTSAHQWLPLPEKLPPGLEDSIRKLVTAARTSEGESKLKFFSQEINSILLDIELQCRELGGPLRSKVYTHLSAFLPCSRDTLLKRVKKLLVKHMEEPPDLENPMHKLKEAIGKAMPEQIACFQENCQVYKQVKTSKTTEEEKHKVSVGSEDYAEEKGGKRGPRKLFKWNEEIRECLCHVLKVKLESNKKEMKGSQELEEYLKTLLNNEVKPLWPKGWMQYRVLIRESRKMLSLSSLPVKRTRPEKKQHQPSISGPPSVLPGSPSLKVLPQGADDVFMEGSNISCSMPLGGVMKVGDTTGNGATVDTFCSTPTESDEPLVKATSAQTNSLLNLLADQALAREQPGSVSQHLIAAAVAKYKLKVQRWSFGVDKSPPLPPPPPRPSPVNFPMSASCQVGSPKVLQIGDFARHMDAGQVQIISDDSDTTIQ